MKKTKPVTLAAIAGAVGVAGEVRLKLFGEGWETLKSYGSFNDGALTITKIRSDNKGGAVAGLAGVKTREAAEALRGTTLDVSRDDLPSLAEGEFYHADLLGLHVVTDAGEPVGKVVAVQNFGATDIIEIERGPESDAPGELFMVPLTEQAVPEWDDTKLVVTEAFCAE